MYFNTCNYLKSKKKYEFSSQFSINFWINYQKPLQFKKNMVIFSLDYENSPLDKDCFFLAIRQDNPLTLLTLNYIYE